MSASSAFLAARRTAARRRIISTPESVGGPHISGIGGAYFCDETSDALDVAALQIGRAAALQIGP